jgi:hypothetical protein
MGVPVSTEPVEVYSGDEWTVEITFLTDEGVPVNMSSFTSFKSEWRVQEFNPYNVHVLTVTMNDLAHGKIRVTATPEQTLAMQSDGVVDIVVDDKQTLLKFPTLWVKEVTL